MWTSARRTWSVDLVTAPEADSAVPVRVPAAGSRAPASVLRLHDGRTLGAAGPVLSDAHGWVFRGDRQDGYREHSPGQYGLVPAAVPEFVLTAMFLFTGAPASLRYVVRSRSRARPSTTHGSGS